MKKIRSLFHFMFSVVMLFIMGAVGSGFSSAADALDGNAVEDLTGGGKGGDGAMSVTQTETIQDAEWYVKQLNKTIVEMKFTGTPIDQILRTATFNKSESIVVKYYSVGQRPLTVTLKTQFTEMANETPKALELNNSQILGAMDTLLVMDNNGNLIKGYKPGTSEEDPEHPLQIRVHAISTETNQPLV